MPSCLGGPRGRAGTTRRMAGRSPAEVERRRGHGERHIRADVTTSMAPPGGGGLSLEDLKGNASRLRRERLVRYLLTMAALTSLLISALIVGSLVREAWTFVSQVELSRLWTTGWFPRD